MADENTGLLVTIEARTAAFEKALARIEKKADTGFAAIKKSADQNIEAVEKTLDRANAFEKRMSAIDRGFIGFGKSLIPSLGAITAALSVREVAAYADAWTSAKNSLAVAGVTGERQRVILDKLFDSAQRNSTPLTALADLYGKAAQSSDMLGASQDQLVKFSDTVALALKVSGTNAQEASGSLLQLGQALGSGTVHAEEFNSILEGTPALAKAAAAGIKQANGSISNLKQLVVAGKISSKDLFSGIIDGSKLLEDMSSNSAQTIEQSMVRVTNAFTKYIGQTDENLSASVRLRQGINALADNFDEAADSGIQLATILGAAFIGRSVGGLLAQVPKLALGVGALWQAFAAGGAGATAAIGSILGPLGILTGVVAGVAFVYSSMSKGVDDATKALASQAASVDVVQGMIDSTAKAQDAYRAAIASTAGAQTTASNSIVADTEREFAAKKSLLELELKRQRALIAMQQASLAQQSEALKSEVGSKVFTRNSAVERGFSDPKVGDLVRLPDSITGLEKTQDIISKSPITAEIQKIRAEMELTQVGANKLEEALNSTFASDSSGAAKPVDTGTGKSKSGGGSRLDEYQRLTQRVAEATAATLAETQAQAALNPTVEDFGYAANKARIEQELLSAALKAGKEVTPELKAEISGLATGYAEAEAAAGRLSETQQKAKDALNSQKDIAKGFLSDIRSALDDGKVTWEEWGNIAMNVLNKVIDKLENQLVDALFSVNTSATSSSGGSGSIFGSLFSGVGKLFGFDDGGITGANNQPIHGKIEVLQ